MACIIVCFLSANFSYLYVFEMFSTGDFEHENESFFWGAGGGGGGGSPVHFSGTPTLLVLPIAAFSFCSILCNFVLY
jgi:hypothetical protein